MYLRPKTSLPVLKKYAVAFNLVAKTIDFASEILIVRVGAELRGLKRDVFAETSVENT